MALPVALVVVPLVAASLLLYAGNSVVRFLCGCVVARQMYVQSPVPGPPPSSKLFGAFPVTVWVVWALLVLHMRSTFLWLCASPAVVFVQLQSSAHSSAIALCVHASNCSAMHTCLSFQNRTTRTPNQSLPTR